MTREQTLQMLRRAIARQSATALAAAGFVLFGLAIGAAVMIMAPRERDDTWAVLMLVGVLVLMAAGAWPLWRGALRGLRPTDHPVYRAVERSPETVLSVAELYEDVEVHTGGVVVQRSVSTFHFLLEGQSRHRIVVAVSDASALADGLRMILPHATVSIDPKRP